MSKTFEVRIYNAKSGRKVGQVVLDETDTLYGMPIDSWSLARDYAMSVLCSKDQYPMIDDLRQQ